MNNNAFLSAISNLRPSSTFLTLSDYKNSQGELADYSIVFHSSYESLLRRSISQLEQYVPLDNLERQAKMILLSSYEKSLAIFEKESLNDRGDGYLHFQDSNGRWIKGIKLHEASNTIHISGKVIHKNVKKSSHKKEVNSKPLTLAKQKISENLPISKWRQFKLTPDRLSSVAVEHMILEAPNE